MSDIHKSLRLGDLLVEKGLISAYQLRQAIEIQKFRYSYKSELTTITKKYELGEILIELGFIDRQQLNSNLSWQRRLKATTAMMVFVAPLLTAACGGGAGAGSSNGNSTPQQSGNVSSQVLPASTEALSSSSVSSAPVSSAAVSSVKSSSSLSSAPAVVPKSSSSVSSAVSSVKSSSSSSSSTASSVAPTAIDGAVQIYWSVPVSRENGDYLDITEIGGYEVRYKLKSDTNYTSIVIKDAFIDAYYFDYLKGDYEFEIATFDKTGLYSKFIPVAPES